MGSKDIQFLWDLIRFFWLTIDPKRAKELAASIYEMGINIPNNLEGMVVEFWSNENELAIQKIALTCVKEHYFDIEKHIVLIALLVEKNLLGLNNAGPLLTGINITENDSNVSDEIKRVIDVAWLINKDSNDGVMEAQDDSLLQDALSKVVASSGT